MNNNCPFNYLSWFILYSLTSSTSAKYLKYKVSIFNHFDILDIDYIWYSMNNYPFNYLAWYILYSYFFDKVHLLQLCKVVIKGVNLYLNRSMSWISIISRWKIFFRLLVLVLSVYRISLHLWQLPIQPQCVNIHLLRYLHYR